MLIPRKKTPDLSLPTLDGDTFDLEADGGERGSVLCFYRGLHCPICITQLKSFEQHAEAFRERGVRPVAISTDGQERAAEMKRKTRAETITFAYDLPLQTARDFGLYLSEGRGTTSIGIEEPAIFSEPGLFLINRDRTLYFGSVQTMPFTRPPFDELLKAVDAAIERNYPARGEYTGPV